MFLVPWKNFMPVINPDLRLKSKALLKDSTKRMKRNGERGNPCLRHVEDWKRGPGLPLTRGEIQGRELQAYIREMVSSLKPLFLKAE